MKSFNEPAARQNPWGQCQPVHSRLPRALYGEPDLLNADDGSSRRKQSRAIQLITELQRTSRAVLSLQVLEEYWGSIPSWVSAKCNCLLVAGSFVSSRTTSLPPSNCIA